MQRNIGIVSQVGNGSKATVTLDSGQRPSHIEITYLREWNDSNQRSQAEEQVADVQVNLVSCPYCAILMPARTAMPPLQVPIRCANCPYMFCGTCEGQ